MSRAVPGSVTACATHPPRAMRRIAWGWVSLLFLLAGVSPPALGAESFDARFLQGLGDTRYHRLESEVLDRPLHVYVRVPEPESPARRYPTVFVLDGGAFFPLLSAYYHALRWGEEVPEMIVVGISYGSDRFKGGNYRASDFTAPAADREWWGGAPKFQQALAAELLPLIEARYPADPRRRILLGQSLGGQFVLYSALTRPELFFGHIASNPALHRNLDWFLDWRGEAAMPNAATRLFLVEAEFDDARFRQPALKWIEHWSAADRQAPFRLEVRMLEGHTHLSAVTEAFRLGVPWLLGADLAASGE
ncbi:MAG: alpha/beta hydrolase-fold protein [Xanthomonadales bacterium]